MKKDKYEQLERLQKEASNALITLEDAWEQFQELEQETDRIKEYLERAIRESAVASSDLFTFFENGLKGKL